MKTRPSLPGMMVLLVVACAGAGVRDWPDEEREGIRINYTEARAGDYVLPDPLALPGGGRVTDAGTWMKTRRPQIVRLFEENQFGRALGDPADVRFELFDRGTPVFGGEALRRQVTLHFGGGTAADLLLYLPAGPPQPAPLLLNIGFAPNSQTVRDPGVREGRAWGADGKRVPAAARSPFPATDVLPFIRRGYGFATIYYGDIEPDSRAGLAHGVRARYLAPGRSAPAPDEWGAIAAWAWGLSRVMDYLETDPGVDARRVALTGVSRLGKTALWTAAADPRFALVLASCSGEGGAALSRRDYGETIKLITLPQRYGYQFCGNYARWADDPRSAPMDAHMLLALIAPRPVLLQTGDSDKWSDPVGEFLAALAAEPVYRLFGKKGPGVDRLPPAGTPAFGDLGYYMHRGGHGMQAEDGTSDWDVFLDFMDRHLRPVALFPADGSTGVNPDTPLKLTFGSAPAAGRSGTIRIYDAADGRLVDTLDLAIPAGPEAPTPSPGADYTPVPYPYAPGRPTNRDTRPGTPSGGAEPAPGAYQLTIIGGFTDGFHFRPVTVRGNTATLHPHHDLLEYGRTYYVEIDPGVLVVGDGAFRGISGRDGWRFMTRSAPPSLASGSLTVSADGAGDFTTVQGAVDFIPDSHPGRVTVFIRKGRYEEIVYFRNKNDITLLGEDRDGVVVAYENSEVFNPHPPNLKTNEVAGTFPSRRAVFAADHCRGIHLANLTIENTAYGQAEGLLLNGAEFVVRNVTVVGSGDALQVNGSAYFADSRIVGDGDTILGRGPAFFTNCELNSYGHYMWVRNPRENHGNVFVNCLFKTRGDGRTVLARNPRNGGKTYPYSEAVLIDCRLSGIDPAGWGDIGGEVADIRYWEYNSRNAGDGSPVDTSRRHPASRRLILPRDAATIAEYRNPAFVLGEWILRELPGPEAPTRSGAPSRFR